MPATVTVVNPGSDISAPTLSALTLSSPTVVPGQALTITATIADDLSGVASLGGTCSTGSSSLQLQSQSVSTQQSFTSFTRVTGDTYRWIWTPGTYAASGLWSITRIELSDCAGNRVSIRTDELQARGMPATVTVVNPGSDISAPTLSALTLSSPTVVPGQALTITATIADDLSGVASLGGTCSTGSSSLQLQSQSVTTQQSFTSFTRVAGNTYRWTWTPGAYAASGLWSIVRVDLTDCAGNRVSLNTLQLSAMALPSSIRILGNQIAVTQAGNPPTLEVTPRTLEVPAQGASSAFTVTSSVSDATWTASSGATWLSISPTAGIGSASVNVSAAPTSSVSPRTATILIAGQSVTVTQSGGAGRFSLDSSSLQVPGTGATRTVRLTSTMTDAPWSATSSLPWVTVSPESGVGSSTLTLAIRPQGSFAGSRTGAVAIAGIPLDITQEPTTEPGPPRLLTGSVTGTRVIFRWSAPEGGGPVGSYLLEYGFSAGRTDGASISVGTMQEFAVNVPPGRFFIRVKAQNSYGISAASNEVELRIGIEGQSPGRPQALTSVVQGNRVTLQWSPPAGGDPPTGYLLEAGSAPGLSDGPSIGLGADNSFVVDNVPAGLYYARVRAVNSFGASAPSEDSLIVVGGAAEPPQRPAGLVATVDGDRVRFRWLAPTGGGPSTGYVLEAGSEIGLSDITSITLGNALDFSVDGVPPGIYFVRVRAGNRLGLSAPSNDARVAVGVAGGADRPIGRELTRGYPPPAAPNGPLRLEGMVTERTVHLNWERPLVAPNGTTYRIEVSTTDAGPPTWFTSAATARTLTLREVPAGLYFARLVAAHPSGWQAVSNALMILIP
jgi:hypothetical protein